MPEKKITSENIDIFLEDLAKEYKKLTHGKANAELVIVGGGAILLNHKFRDTTNDIDALIGTDSAMAEAISKVADHYDLPPEQLWLLSCFTLLFAR